MSIKDLGQEIVRYVKPDGTSIIPKAISSSSLTSGIASRITGLLPSAAADKINAGISSILQADGKMGNPANNLTNIILNPLENFASYIPMWTFACLDKNQFNNPTTYRNNPSDLKYVVFSSGGRFDSQRVKTAYGAPEYFVNNFVMHTAIAANSSSGNSNAFKFTWDIIEPHSMGLLLQSMQNAAINAGYANYLKGAPFVLRLDFMGFNEEGQVMTSIKPKFWTVQLTKCTFTVNENGSVYKVEAVPMSHMGFSDQVNTAYTDVKLTCSNGGANAGTVMDVLTTGENSLCKYLNDNEQKLFNEKKIGVKDIYVIEFPEKSDEFLNSSKIPGVQRKATMDPKAPDTVTTIGSNVTVKTDFGENEIGKAEFGFDQKRGGNYPFSLHGDQVDKNGIVNRDGMKINPKSRTFQFAQGQRLTKIINQIILSSDYAKRALDPKNLVDGFIKWWRIDVQIQLLDLDVDTGDYAMKFIYRVVPFLVHHTVFSPPTAVPIGYKELAKQVVKQYNYIYTGKNVDVLKFDIEINNLFYSGTNPSAEAKSGKVANQDRKGTAPDPAKVVTTETGNAPAALTASFGRNRLKKDPDALKKQSSGGGDKSTEQQVAEQFHKAFTSAGSGDLVKVNLEILGDPYWMVDSGIGNYFARQSPKSRLLTEDGTMNYEGGDVFIYLTFNTPADIDEATGLYQFPTAGKESPFSGIFRVTQCENTFNDGIFRQKLNCVRQVGQSQDFTGNNPNTLSTLAIDKLKGLAIKIGGDEKPKTDPSQENKAKEYNGPVAPNYAGGYKGEQTVAGGGGYDPRNPNGYGQG